MANIHPHLQRILHTDESTESCTREEFGKFERIQQVCVASIHRYQAAVFEANDLFYRSSAQLAQLRIHCEIEAFVFEFCIPQLQITHQLFEPDGTSDDEIFETIDRCDLDGLIPPSGRVLQRYHRICFGLLRDLGDARTDNQLSLLER